MCMYVFGVHAFDNMIESWLFEDFACGLDHILTGLNFLTFDFYDSRVYKFSSFLVSDSVQVLVLKNSVRK